MLQSAGRLSGKSYSLKGIAQQVAKYTQHVHKYVVQHGYAQADAQNAIVLGNAIHRAHERALKPRYSSRFMHQLATAVLSPVT